MQALVPAGFMLAADGTGSLSYVLCPDQGAPPMLPSLSAGMADERQSHHGHEGLDGSDKLPTAGADNTCGFALAFASVLPMPVLAMPVRINGAGVTVVAPPSVAYAALFIGAHSARGPPVYS